MPESAGAIAGGAASGAAAGAVFGPWGAAAGAVIGAGAALITGALQSKDAISEANMIHAQAQMTRQQIDEQARRAELMNQQKLGEGTAAAGASGFAKGGSMTQYLGQMATEMQRETSWLKQTGYQTAAYQDRAAQLIREGADASQITGILGGATSMFNSLTKMGSEFNWFGGGSSSAGGNAGSGWGSGPGMD